METLFMTVWFFATAIAGFSLVVALFLRAVRLDNRDVAKFETFAPVRLVTPSAEPQRKAA